MPSRNILLNNILTITRMSFTRLKEEKVNFGTKMLRECCYYSWNHSKEATIYQFWKDQAVVELSFSESPCLREASLSSSQSCYWGEKLCLLLAGTQQLAGTHTHSSHRCSGELPPSQTYGVNRCSSTRRVLQTYFFWSTTIPTSFLVCNGVAQ